MFRMRSEILVLKNTIFFVQNTNFWMSKYKFLFFKVGRSDTYTSLKGSFCRYLYVFACINPLQKRFPMPDTDLGLFNQL